MGVNGNPTHFKRKSVLSFDSIIVDIDILESNFCEDLPLEYFDQLLYYQGNTARSVTACRDSYST